MAERRNRPSRGRATSKDELTPTNSGPIVIGTEDVGNASSYNLDNPSPRKGLIRRTLARSSSGRCHNCGRIFEHVTGAVSHARATRHVVDGTYQATYLYTPDDEGSS
jgi:hypothetical protein